MNRVILLLLLMALPLMGWSQFKKIPQGTSPKKVVDFSTMEFNFPESFLKSPEQGTKSSNSFQFQTLDLAGLPSSPYLKRIVDTKTGLPILIEAWKGEYTPAARGDNADQQLAFGFLGELSTTMGMRSAEEEFRLTVEKGDPLGQKHLRFEQTWNDIPVYGGDIWIHIKEEKIVFNGRYVPTPSNVALTPRVQAEEALEIVQSDLSKHAEIVTLSPAMLQFVGGESHREKLMIYPAPDGEGFHLAWEIEMVPHVGDRWKYFVDAQTGAVLHKHQMLCKLHAFPLEEVPFSRAPLLEFEKTAPTTFEIPSFSFDVVTSQDINGVDLNGVNRTLKGFQAGSEFLMVDISRPMFDANASNLPNEPIGAIWTLDAFNTSPSPDFQGDFQNDHIRSQSATYNNPNGISAHYNASVSYEYFLNTFNRNSINGKGGTVISLINVADTDGQGLDNAFWNGAAMFYGSGQQAFSPLAGSLDVGGHEMSHGVVQETANLEYMDESGALNESFADIFGVMIDRDDWKLGEDVVNPNFFPSGALRDMENPNNGGTRLGDPGYQPDNVSDQFFGEANNGGVHINSGIPNRAYYLFATNPAVGLERAEQVFYRALDVYLTRNSQFVDLRTTVEQAAADLYDQTIVDAASNAFAQVGIGGGQTTPPPPDLPVNPGNTYMALTDGNQQDLFVVAFVGNAVQLFFNFEDVFPISRPSISDDGRSIIFVDALNNLQLITIDYEQASAQLEPINEEGIWRNAVLSRDGGRLAVLSNIEGAENNIFIFAVNQAGELEIEAFELFNPTTANGGFETADVIGADALEWDFSGEFVMYDAENQISSFFGATTFWDIGFLKAWDNNSNTFGDGSIGKLFSSLPNGVSVGNPTFAKNSSNVIALDWFDEISNEFYVVTANLQTSTLDTIFFNIDLGFPSYSIDDTQVTFNAFTQQFEPIIASVPLAQDRSTPIGSATIFLQNEPVSAGLQKGEWFADGNRVLTSTKDREALTSRLSVFPNPFKEAIQVAFDSEQSGTARIQLVDLMGRELMRRNQSIGAGANQWTIDTPDLPAGTYWLRIQMEGQAGVQQVIKR